MAFAQKTWKDRVAEYINRRILTKEDGTTELVSVERSEGTISQEGDAFSAENMNDLEQRIANEFSEQNKNLVKYNSETDCLDVYSNGVLIGSLNVGLQTPIALVPVMTSDTAPSGEAFAKSILESAHAAYKAFNGTNTGVADCWHSAKNLPQWLGYRFEQPVCVKAFYLENRNFDGSGTYSYAAKTFTLEASNDGATWHPLETYTNNNSSSKYGQKYYTENKNHYLMYRINVSESHANYNDYCIIAKLQFYGAKL